MNVPLTIGETYTITDHYGMMGFDAVYRGILEDENRVNLRETRLLLFEKVDRRDGAYRWAGVSPEVSIGPKGLYVRLIAHHYGNTPNTVEHCARGRYTVPKWRKAK